MLSKVKNLEIYELPDGKSYYAAPSDRGTWYLYSLKTPADNPVFEIDQKGRIKPWPETALYSLEELKPTGKQFKPQSEKHYVLVLSTGDYRLLLSPRS